MTPEEIVALNAARKKHYRKHAKEISAYNNGPNSWKARNRGYVAGLMKQYRLDQLAKDPDWERRACYKKRYGITLEQYNEMLAEQHNSCAICLGPPRGRLRFHVDHDHATGVIRGLLCWRCNAALGNLEESPDILQRMLDYLSVHKPFLQKD